MQNKIKIYHNKFLLLIFLITVLISCTRNITNILPEYKNKIIHPDKLYIQFLPDSPLLSENFDSFLKNKNNLNDSNFISFLKQNIQTSIQYYSALNEIDLIDNFSNFNEEIIKDVNNKKILLKKPQKENIPNISTKNIKYVLFLENFKMSFSTNNLFIIPIDLNFFFLYNNSEELVLNCKFLIWDNNLLKTISYGRIKLNEDIKSGEVKKALSNLLDRLAKKIFIHNPFRI